MKVISSVRVSEAVTLSSHHFRRPLELSGYLIVSSHLVCVVEDEATARSGRPHFGILVNRDAIDALNTPDMPLLGGSSVSIAGNISLKGNVTHTGIPTLPLYIAHVYAFTFWNDFGSWTFEFGDTFKDIYLLPPRTVAPRSLSVVKPLFDPALTVIQLKRQLESGNEHCVGQHLRGEAFAQVVATIEAAGFQWRAEESEISRGVP